MNHLTTTDIIDFVSINRIDENSLNLASKVNGHILKCDDCLKLVKAFQEVYDELQRMGRSSEFEQILKKDHTELINNSDIQNNR